MRSVFGLASWLAIFLAFAAQVYVAPAVAQEIFHGVAPAEGNPQTQGNPDCPPPVINGVTPKNWSCKTGTQGVQGNPYCPPPVIMIDGKPTTPRNWSCPGGTPSARTLNGQWDRGHPGFPTVTGSTPCQPGGPGGYNWLNNAEGTRLPPGCMRPTRRIITKTDQRYEPARPGSYIVPPAGPPGSYIQPEGRPGSYIVPPAGPPGSYIQSEGRPGSYIVPPAGPPGSYIQSDRPEPSIRSTSGPGASGTHQVHTGSGAQSTQNGGGYRQDTAAMQGGAVSNRGAADYRQDTSAMRGTISGSGPSVRTTGGSSATNSSAAKKSNAAANAQAAKTVKGIMNMLGNGP
jgi:hypothetical protein